MSSAVCGNCFRGCTLAEGATGACRARSNVGGSIVCTAYGRVSSIAVDPVEKKPLSAWKSGHSVLSLGGYGCNLRCPWCQNASISQVGEDGLDWHEISPEELAALARRLADDDPLMAGVAYTYNEPLVAWEYVRDCARLVHAEGLANVLVSAGCVSERIVDEIAPFIDAANIDLKCFSDEGYRALGGSFEQAKATIERLASEPGCHLEVTTLIVPGVNDTDEEMDALASWLSSVDAGIVLHVTRFFPAWRMRDTPATPVGRVYGLAELARRRLPRVQVGNC